jgi:hypothetical protein
MQALGHVRPRLVHQIWHHFWYVSGAVVQLPFPKQPQAQSRIFASSKLFSLLRTLSATFSVGKCRRHTFVTRRAVRSCSRPSLATSDPGLHELIPVSPHPCSQQECAIRTVRILARDILVRRSKLSGGCQYSLTEYYSIKEGFIVQKHPSISLSSLNPKVWSQLKDLDQRKCRRPGVWDTISAISIDDYAVIKQPVDWP